MKTLMFSVRDAQSALFGRPFFETNEMTARRAVAMQVNSDPASSVLAAAPGDFELFYLGSFDEASGLIDLETPRSLFNLSTLVRRD